jgi:NADH-quinone oxidoreductase subunit M
LFAAFSLAFMIKVPMFPFHTWLPDAHVEAPTAGSVILAGVLLKMGTYGFIRFCLPMFPHESSKSAWLFITLAIIGIIYGSLVAAVQTDAKKLVAYSSVAHLGFVVLGIFSFTRIGMMGALVQNINHGISTPMLFFMVGMLYDRRHTRLITEFGGLKKIVPMLATLLLIATLSSIAVPFFNGFVGEFPILLGSWISHSRIYFGAFDLPSKIPTAFAATGMILSAVYMLWWFQRLMLGPVTKEANRHMVDLSRQEWVVLTPLVALIFWIGLGSPFWTQRMDKSVDTLITRNTEQLSEDLPIKTHLIEERRLREIGPRKPEPPPTMNSGERITPSAIGGTGGAPRPGGNPRPGGGRPGGGRPGGGQPRRGGGGLPPPPDPIPANPDGLPPE